MTKLNQIVAVEKGVKSNTQRTVTDIYHQLKKPDLLAGITRTYQPRDEEGEQLPPESKHVQVRVDELLRDAAAAMTRMFDVTLTKDTTNCVARADVVVDGQVLAEQVPVTYLLFLEKQLTDLATLVKSLPLLDPAEVWSYSDTSDCWQTASAQTVRTRKVPRNHVKAEATERHPAQVEVYTEDVQVGTWSTVKFSGAVPAARAKVLQARIVELQEAVKTAREQANMADVADKQIGDALFGYLLAD